MQEDEKMCHSYGKDIFKIIYFELINIPQQSLSVIIMFSVFSSQVGLLKSSCGPVLPTSAVSCGRYCGDPPLNPHHR